jgi:protein ImuB
VPAAPEARHAPPLGFIEKQRGAFRLVAVNRVAHDLGLTPGMPLADAQARVPDLRAIPHDAGANTALLSHMADLYDRLSPMVATHPPQGILLDISGCAHLFGGERGTVEAAVKIAQHQRLHAAPALANTPEAAMALARFIGHPVEDEVTHIRALPIAALELSSDHERALDHAGLKSIGMLATRPTAPLAARFGMGAVDRLDRLLGRTDSRITPRRAPPELVIDRIFAEPIARTAHMLETFRDLLNTLCQQLLERHQGGRAFRTSLYRADGVRRDLLIETGQPVRDSDVVMRLLTERIDTLSDPLDPGFGFDQIRLAILHAEPLGLTQPALDGSDGAHAQEDIARLIDRLSTRYGERCFCRLSPHESHLPERAQRHLPVHAPIPVSWPEPPAGEPPLRPLFLLRPPQRVEVLAAVPDGPPRRFRWQRSMHEVVRYEGPERIAPEWWRQPQGNPGRTRDYYRVEDAEGRRFWLFRHGLYGTEAAHPDWYLHGLFA